MRTSGSHRAQRSAASRLVAGRRRLRPTRQPGRHRQESGTRTGLNPLASPPGLGAARRVVRVFGELILTCGVVALLYCGYSLYWTTYEASAAADQDVQSLQQEWKRDRDAVTPTPAAARGGRTPLRPGKPSQGRQEAPRPSASFALLRIPRLRGDWVKPVFEGRGLGLGGIASEDLGRGGVVHYPGTAQPGELGNFAVAGHRATNGAPFADLDQVEVGDEIAVETKKRNYTYTVTKTSIVSPTSTEVLAPVPGRPGATPDKAWLTLTTCHPRYSSTFRLIVTAELTSEKSTK